MLQRTLDHFLKSVLPAAGDYHSAETALSMAYTAAGNVQHKCLAEANNAKRQAANVAIAIDGLADRAANAFNATPQSIRDQVSALCVIDGVKREGCLARICAVANAYKHDELNDPKHPIKSNDDVLVVGGGYGVDGFGIGKYSGIEVMVHQTDGDKRKFLGDVPFAIAGWISFLKKHGAELPNGTIMVCGMRVSA
jgi:hypothetical protein